MSDYGEHTFVSPYKRGQLTRVSIRRAQTCMSINPIGTLQIQTKLQGPRSEPRGKIAQNGIGINDNFLGHFLAYCETIRPERILPVLAANRLLTP